MLAQTQMCLGNSDQCGCHDLIAERVGQHSMLMNARLVRKCVIAYDGLVWRGAKGDDLPQHLARRVQVIELDASRNAIAISAHIERRCNLFESRITGTLTDAVDGALHLTSSI